MLFRSRAKVRGDRFSISDSLPLVSMDVNRAEEKILLACQRGDGEVIITGWANPAVWLQTMAPNLVQEFLSVVNYLLPEMGGIGRRAAKGYESESKLSPSWLTRMGDQAALENNEYQVESGGLQPATQP